jgi:hypothetical protein
MFVYKDADQVNAKTILQRTPNGRGRHVWEIFKKLDPQLHFLSDPKERPWNKGAFDNLDELETSYGAPEEIALRKLVFAVKLSERKNALWMYVNGNDIESYILTGEYDVEFVGNFYDNNYDEALSKFEKQNDASHRYSRILKKIRKGVRLSPEDKIFKEEMEGKPKALALRLPTGQEETFNRPEEFEQTKTLDELEELVETKSKVRKGIN